MSDSSHGSHGSHILRRHGGLSTPTRSPARSASVHHQRALSGGAAGGSPRTPRPFERAPARATPGRLARRADKQQEHAAYYERCAAELEQQRASRAAGAQSREAAQDAFDLLAECLAVSNEDNKNLSATLDQVEEGYVDQAALVLQLTEALRERQALLDEAVAARDEALTLVKHLQHRMSGYEKNTARRMLLSSAHKMQQRGVAKSLNAWRAFVMRKISIRDTMRKVVKRVQSMACAAAFSGWRQYTVGKVGVEGRLQRTAKRIQNIALSSAFIFWQSFAQRACHVRRISEKAMARLRHLWLSKSFAAGW
eukprot:COSAG06_NODE_1978_length_7929_cov_17.252298_1_plen_310_part_00